MAGMRPLYWKLSWAVWRFLLHVAILAVLYCVVVGVLVRSEICLNGFNLHRITLSFDSEILPKVRLYFCGNHPSTFFKTCIVTWSVPQHSVVGAWGCECEDDSKYQLATRPESGGQ